MVEGEHQTPHHDVAVTPAELRDPKLPLQSLGGYSRAETIRLLDRAARTLEQNSSSKQTEISTVEQAVGEVLVTAHHAAEIVRNEARQEADGLLEAARSEARELVADAKRQTEELEAAKARVEDALVRAQEEARASREAAKGGRIRFISDRVNARTLPTDILCRKWIAAYA